MPAPEMRDIAANIIAQCGWRSSVIEERIAEALAAAYVKGLEDAAKIAETSYCDEGAEWGDGIADAIRSRIKDHKE